MEKLRKKLCERGFEAVGITIVFLMLVFPPSINAIVSVEPIDKENPSDQYFSDDINYYALLIGVEKFDEAVFPEVYIDEGAIGMYETLVNNGNWVEENIKLLLNENATKANIQEAITCWLDDKETENDVVLYYFTGHSWKISLRNRAKGHTYTYPFDLSQNKITDVELDYWLDGLESKHVAVILDTCYSGRMRALCQPGRTMLAAGGKYLLCPVDGDYSLECGIFTYHLLQGFEGVADINDDGWVPAEEVFRYARMPTFHFSFWKQFPFKRYLPLIIGPQLPYMHDRHLGELPLIELPSNEEMNSVQ